MTGKTTGQDEKGNAFVGGWSAASAARLKAAIKQYGSQSIVAEKALISRQSLVEILRFDETKGTGSRPRFKTLYALCDVLNVDEDDVIGAPGRVTFAAPDVTQPMAADVLLDGHEFSLIKRYEVDASAGPGRFPLTEESSDGVAVPRSWLIKRGLASDCAGLVSVRGDSMVPTIPDGAVALLQIVSEFDRSGIYVFSREGAVGIKRFQPVGKVKNGKPTAFAILSDNPAYEPDFVSGDSLNEIRFIGRVKSIFADVT